MKSKRLTSVLSAILFISPLLASAQTTPLSKYYTFSGDIRVNDITFRSDGAIVGAGGTGSPQTSSTAKKFEVVNGASLVTTLPLPLGFTNVTAAPISINGHYISGIGVQNSTGKFLPLSWLDGNTPRVVTGQTSFGREINFVSRVRNNGLIFGSDPGFGAYESQQNILNLLPIGPLAGSFTASYYAVERNDGKLIIVGAGAKTTTSSTEAYLWMVDTSNGITPISLTSGVAGAAFRVSQSGKLISGKKQGLLTIWDVNDPFNPIALNLKDSAGNLVQGAVNGISGDNFGNAIAVGEAYDPVLDENYAFIWYQALGSIQRLKNWYETKTSQVLPSGLENAFCVITNDNRVAFSAVGDVSQYAAYILETANPVATTVTKKADLSVTAQNTVTNLSTGANVSVKFSVKNTGPDVATNVVLNYSTPPDLTVSSCASTNSGVCNGNSITIPSLDSGATATIDLAAKVACESIGDIVATVTADTIDPDDTNNTARARIEILAALPTITNFRWTPSAIAAPANPDQWIEVIVSYQVNSCKPGTATFTIGESRTSVPAQNYYLDPTKPNSIFVRNKDVRSTLFVPFTLTVTNTTGKDSQQGLITITKPQTKRGNIIRTR